MSTRESKGEKKNIGRRLAKVKYKLIILSYCKINHFLQYHLFYIIFFHLTYVRPKKVSIPNVKRALYDPGLR